MESTDYTSKSMSNNTQVDSKLQKRYLLSKVYNMAASVNVAVIMMNPKVKNENQYDEVLENVLTCIEKNEKNALNQINIVNLFPFVTEDLSAMEQQIQTTDLHKNKQIIENLVTIKKVIKNANKIVLAWGNPTPGFSENYYKTAIADVYHMIRMFNKIEDCYVFSILETNNPLNTNENPFHPKEGTIIELNQIKLLWMENNVLKINVKNFPY